MQEANIPMRSVGPIKIIGTELNAEVKVPLATFETPLWASVSRGAKISRLTDGISVTIIKDCMTRSILLEAPNAKYANEVTQDLNKQRSILEQIVLETSQFAELQDWHFQIIGNLLYIRFSLDTKDAAGHNMSTLIAEKLLNWIITKYGKLKYISVSGNYCTDKKNSAVNGILGRGKHTIAELLIPRNICISQLNTTPEKIVDINIKKNLIGSIIAGSVHSANAHFANMLLAFYLATGQDAANIVEGSQGIVHTQIQKEDLYFSVTLPNIIIGSVGNGKNLNFVKDNLKMLGCTSKCDVGKNAKRLAYITAATILCGELSLLSALTNKGELMKSHIKLERKTQR